MVKEDTITESLTLTGFGHLEKAKDCLNGAVDLINKYQVILKRIDTLLHHPGQVVPNAQLGTIFDDLVESVDETVRNKDAAFETIKGLRMAILSALRKLRGEESGELTTEWTQLTLNDFQDELALLLTVNKAAKLTAHAIHRALSGQLPDAKAVETFSPSNLPHRVLELYKKANAPQTAQPVYPTLGELDNILMDEPASFDYHADFAREKDKVTLQVIEKAKAECNRQHVIVERVEPEYDNDKDYYLFRLYTKCPSTNIANHGETFKLSKYPQPGKSFMDYAQYLRHQLYGNLCSRLSYWFPAPGSASSTYGPSPLVGAAKAWKMKKALDEAKGTIGRLNPDELAALSKDAEQKVKEAQAEGASKAERVRFTLTRALQTKLNSYAYDILQTGHVAVHDKVIEGVQVNLLQYQKMLEMTGFEKAIVDSIVNELCVTLHTKLSNPENAAKIRQNSAVHIQLLLEMVLQRPLKLALETELALWQQKNNLEPTGQADEETINRLNKRAFDKAPLTHEVAAAQKTKAAPNAPIQAKAQEQVFPNLQPGDTGPAVLALVDLLSRATNSPKVSVDETDFGGVYNFQLAEKIRVWNTEHGLAAHGANCWQPTWKSLLEATEKPQMDEFPVLDPGCGRVDPPSLENSFRLIGVEAVPLLDIGSTGKHVGILAHMLAELYQLQDDIGGHYNARLRDWVLAWQDTHALRPTGVCDKDTWTSILKAYQAK